MLRSRRAVNGRVIDGRRCGRLDAVGAKAVQQGVDIAWVGEREGALGAIVRDGKAQELIVYATGTSSGAKPNRDKNPL